MVYIYIIINYVFTIMQIKRMNAINSRCYTSIAKKVYLSCSAFTYANILTFLCIAV